MLCRHVFWRARLHAVELREPRAVCDNGIGQAIGKFECLGMLLVLCHLIPGGILVAAVAASPEVAHENLR